MKNLKAKNLAKILTLLLSVALVCTGIILSVSAADGDVAEVTVNGETTSYATFDAALDAADAGAATVKLIGNAQMTSRHDINHGFTLDLNGYTLTVSIAETDYTGKAFCVFTADPVLITGTGIINANCYTLVETFADGYSSEDASNANKLAANVSIIGDGGYININHNGTNGEFGNLFYLKSKDNNHLKNLKINSNATETKIINVGAGARLTMEGVSVTALNGSNTMHHPDPESSAWASYGAVVQVTKSSLGVSDVVLNYCNFNVKGFSLFDMSGGQSTTLEINNSNLVAKPTGTGETQRPHFIFSSYNSLNSDIKINNSYVEYSHKLTVSGSAKIYLDNSTLAMNSNAEFSRTAAISMANGSKLIGVDGANPILHQWGAPESGFSAEFVVSEDGNKETVSGISLLIGEGSRFDANTYARITNLANYKTSENGSKDSSNSSAVFLPVPSSYCAFEDGSSPLSSFTYAIIYDPAGDPDAPYLVVKNENVTIDYANATTTTDLPEAHSKEFTSGSNSYKVDYTYSGTYTYIKIPVTATVPYDTVGGVKKIVGYYEYVNKTVTGALSKLSGESYVANKTAGIKITEVNGVAESEISIGIGSNTYTKHIEDGAIPLNWNGPAKGCGTYETATDESGNTFTKYISNGQYLSGTDANGKETRTSANLMMVHSTSTNNATEIAVMKKSAKRIYVYSFDLTSSGDFMKIDSIQLNVRHSSDISASLLAVSKTGVVTPASGVDTTGAVTSSLTLTPNDWNNVTIVADATAENTIRAFAFVNGQYMGTKVITISDDKISSTNIFGIRVNVNAWSDGLTTVGRNLWFDNQVGITYSDYKDADGNNASLGTTSEIAQKYLDAFAAEGYSNFYKEDESTDNITVSGIPVGDIDKAFEIAEETGLIAELTGNVTAPVTVTKSGTLFTNGYGIKNVSEDSTVSYITVKDGEAEIAYVFDEKYAAYEIPLKFYTGAYGANDENSWVNSTENLKLNADIASVLPEGTKVQTYGEFNSNNDYLDTNYIGWSVIASNLVGETNVTLSSDIAVDYYENAENWASGVVGEGEIDPMPVYPVYNKNDIAKRYSVILIKADGTVDSNRCLAASTTELWNGDYHTPTANKKALLAEYGETVMLQSDIVTQHTFDRAWQNAKQNVANKVMTVDLNGYTLICDQNLSQTVYNGVGKVSYVFNVNSGETVNLYSSRADGKIINYGVNYTTSDPEEIDRVECDENTDVTKGDYATVYSKYDTENGYFTQTYYRKVQDAESGQWYAVKYTQRKYMTNNASGGVMFNMNSETGTLSENEGSTQNMHINVGAVQYKDYITKETVTANGGNLTLEACAVIDAYSADRSCTITVNGATLASNSSDNPGIIITRNFYGTMEILNSTIIAPVNTWIFAANNKGASYSSDGAIVDYAKGTVLFDGCDLLVNENGAPIISQLYCMETVTFQNCTTNGNFEITDSHKAAANTNVDLIIGAGCECEGIINEAYLADGVIISPWNNAMELIGGKTSVTAYTFTVKDTVDWSASNQKPTHRYNLDIAYIFTTEAEGGDLQLPTLKYKTVAQTDAVTITYKGLGTNESVIYYYANGAKPDSITQPKSMENFEGSIITATWTGFNADELSAIPEAIEEDIVITSTYTATVTGQITGPQINVAVYSDFGVNIYIPKEHEYITGVEIENAYHAQTETVLGGIAYDKYTVTRQANDSENSVDVKFYISENGVEASKTASISVYEYANMVLKQSNNNTKTTDLMYYMLKYAQAANLKFNGATSENIETLMSKVTNPTIYSYSENSVAISDTDNALLEEVNMHMGINVNSSNLSYIFTFNDAYEVSVKLGDKIYTDDDNDNQIIIENLKVYDFGMPIKFIIGTTEIDFTLANCVGSYYATYDAEDPIAKLVEAFYQYAEAAAAYKGV